MFSLKLRKGFTLLELLIVIAIIGVLIVALLPAITGAPAKGRDSARVAGVNQIVSALESIASRTGSYPAQTASANTDCLDPAALIGLDIKNEIKQFPTVGKAGTDLCLTDGEQFFYKTLTTAGNYIVGVQVETAASSNADNLIDAAGVRGWTDGNTAIGVADRSPVDTAAPFFYVVIK